MIARFRWTFLFGLGVFLLDRVAKIAVLNHFTLGEARPFIPGIMQLRYIQNTGMAFGFLGDHQWISILLTPVIIAVLLVLLARNVFPCPLCQLTLGGIMAGGLGNWTDRLVYGFVVDMFEFTFFRFAVFNVADIFITVGAVVLIIAYALSEWRADRQRRLKAAESSDE